MRQSYSNFIGDIESLNSLLDHVELLGQSPQYLSIKAITSKSAIVMSCSIFEKYLKESFMEFIEEINSIYIPKEYIKDVIWDTNRRSTLDALKLIDKDKLEADYDKVVKVYSASFQQRRKKSKPLLVKEAFSITRDSPGPQTIRTMFSSIGVSGIFSKDVFARELGAEKLVSTRLDSFIKKRHCIVHGYTGITVSSIPEVQAELEFLKKCAHTMDEVFNEEVQRIESSFYRDCFGALELLYNE
ncbi:MAG: HEPN domain-containing protein [Methanosarcina mazei]